MRRLLQPAAGVAAVLFACAWIALLGSVAPAGADATTPATPLPEKRVVIERHVTYTDADGVTLTLDTYQPDTPGQGRPGVMLIHGGAWGTGKSNDVDVEGKLIAREGWVAFSVNYRLADQTSHPWPDELTDVQRAMRWIGAHASDYGIDSQKLVVLGLSAGGHLAALLGTVGTAVDGNGKTITDVNPPVTVAAVAAWSPPTRLAGLYSGDTGTPPDCDGNKKCTSFWRLPLVTNFLGCTPEECVDTYDAASPVQRADAQTRPIWFANSTEEITGLPQATTFDEALSVAGVDHHYEQLTGGAHADEYRSRVWNPMMEWLAAHLGVATPPPISFSGRNILLSPLVVISVVIGLALLIVLLAVALRDDEGAF